MPTRHKKYQDIFWYQNIFLMKMNSSPTTRNLHICPCSTINNKVSKVTGNQTMLGSKPPARCCHSNNGGKKNIVQKHLPCSKKIRNIYMFSLSG